jgi:histidine triad (HIT) family protein
MDCIFCKIASGEIPSYVIYEDNEVMALLDIAPVNYGHTLIIPKKHIANLENISEDDLNKIMNLVKKVGRAVKVGLKAEGYNVQLNNDPVAGQIIPHIHFHVIPREERDGLRLWPQGAYGEGKGRETMAKIKSAFE